MNDTAPTCAARRFFVGAGFPLFVIAAAATYELFLAAIAFLPANGTAWGGFAAEFKQWCFNYDPRTGTMEWAQVAVMLVETPTIALIAVFLWRRNLRGVGSWRGLARRWRALSMGAGAAALAVTGLFLYGSPAPAEEAGRLPFPGERIRSAIQPPAFALEDQGGSHSRLRTRGAR